MRILAACRICRNRRHFVKGQRLLDGAACRHGVHPERMQHRAPGAIEALEQVVFAERVHQKADRAAIHAVDGSVAPASTVCSSFQHEAVAAERHYHARVGRRAVPISRGQSCSGSPAQFLSARRRTLMRATDPGVQPRSRAAPVSGRQGAQASLRCSSTGMSARTLLVRSRVDPRRGPAGAVRGFRDDVTPGIGDQASARR